MRLSSKSKSATTLLKSAARSALKSYGKPAVEKIMNSEQFEAAENNVDTPFGRIHNAKASEVRVVLQRLFSGFIGFRQRIHLKRHINELPDNILKDVGWPDAYAKPFTRRWRGQRYRSWQRQRR
jgi:hypothetical protein